MCIGSTGNCCLFDLSVDSVISGRRNQFACNQHQIGSVREVISSAARAGHACNLHDCLLNVITTAHLVSLSLNKGTC